ncbi:unnamed protein product [Aspergillus oryzae]|nr:unnamed protein product [Aspergillus oryzae]GMF84008.1 unnamed protein product [Aspergillus oryzae]
MESSPVELKSHERPVPDKPRENMGIYMENATDKAQGEPVDHGADTQLHRTLGTRHLTMVALGSAIGMGMWLGSGTSLANGGPASLFIGFLISSSIIWSVCQSIGEMAVIYPLPSAFVQWATIFISPAAGFALGWGYWFSYWITIANELQGGPIGFRYWNAQPVNNGFKGFISVIPTCIFAMAGSENAALVATEVANPRESVPKAIKSVWFRLGLFYILGSLMITLTVDPNDPSLFGGSGSNASPFVIAFKNAGIPILAHITNAVIFISVISTGSISGVGRPWAGYIATIGIGGALAYLNVTHTGAQVFTWLSNLVSLLTLFGWSMICLSHLRFRYTWTLQGRNEAHLPWRSWAYPYAAWWGLIWCLVVFGIQFYLSIWPLHEKTSAKNFFANYISVIAVAIIWVCAQVWYSCPLWADARNIDLDMCRRFYADTVDEESTPVAKSLARKLRVVCK